MLEVRQTEIFTKWIANLRDRRAKQKIAVRIDRLIVGNLGDVKPVGEGVSELRIPEGKGYRVYFVQRGSEIIILLCGGDKKTQTKDIARAKEMAKEAL